jgi:hypothetical protein
MRHRQYALSSRYTPILYNNSTIVQWRILEEYSLEKTLAHLGINMLTALYNIIERCAPLYNNQRTDFLLCHAMTSHNYRHDIRTSLRLAFTARDE